MPTKFYFGGKRVTLPGVYARILSGRQNPPLNFDYGNVLIIDSGQHLTHTDGIRGGSGVAGANASGMDAVYELKSLADFREFVGSGYWWKAAEFLFKPNGTVNGASKVYVVKAATTTPAIMTFTAAKGVLKVVTRDESVLSNGVLSGSELVTGYAYTIETSPFDATKWVLKFWLGTFKGVYNGAPYDEVTQVMAGNNTKLVASSPEFDNMQTLLDWANTDPVFASYFLLHADSVVTGDGVVVAGDITGKADYQLAINGSATYNKMDEALEAVKDLDYTFAITTYETPATVATDTDVVKILNHITNDAKFEKFLFLYGSSNSLTDSISQAIALNSDRTILVHGGVKQATKATSTGLRTWDSFFNMCGVLGRLCGLPPQVPITFKALGYDGLQDNLTSKEQELALEHGVLTVNYDSDRNEFTVLQGVNTLQNNTYQLNPDSTSFSIQIKRIAAKINRDIIIEAKRQLLSDPLGVNRNTLTPRDVEEWVKGFLSRKLADDTQDNLILSFQEVVTERQGDDNYYTTYKFEPNGEITKLFMTGFML